MNKRIRVKRKLRWDRIVVIAMTAWAIWALATIFQIQANMPDSIVESSPIEEVNTENYLRNYLVSEKTFRNEGKGLIGLGTFKVTFYADCEKDQGKWVGKTSTGAKPTVGRTIAVDPKVIPYGTIVWVDANDDGVLERYVAEDCGGGIKQKHIDVLVATYQEGSDRGVIYKEVFIER